MTKHWKTVMSNLCDFSPELRFCSQFHHRIIAPNLSCPQAKRWKSAKAEKTSQFHVVAMPNPTKFHHQHGRNRVGMHRKRWNDAVTPASSYNPRTPTVLKRTASKHGR
jgi:hypothetical protein